MATDYGILEEELTEEKAKLQRELHMHNVRRLRSKQHWLAKNVVQRKQIETLTKQVNELESTVSTSYSLQHALKDHEIKGYLIYLLKMKDYFTRENAAIKERIKQLDLQINKVFEELSVITREKAKLMKTKPKKSPEFILLENMSNRLEQMNKRVSTMRQENKGIMENIIILRKFQRQFKVFEKYFRGKINDLKSRQQELLDKAVSSYEEKDEFKAKESVLQERCFQDMRKTEMNVNALNLCIQRTEKNDAFAKLQATTRIDNRIAEASDMIEKGVTGLEPSMERMQNLQTAISAAAEADTPEEMEEGFQVTDDSFEATFSYLDELLKDINRSTEEINSLKESIKQLIRNMSSTDRKLRLKIKLNQDKAEKELEKADDASRVTEEAKSELNSVLDIVKSLYTTCCPKDADALVKTPIDETNIFDYLQAMDKELLDYLMCQEYISLRKASDASNILTPEEDEDEDEDSEDEYQNMEHASIVQPSSLLSKADLLSQMDLQSEKSLKERAIAAVSDVQSENTEEEVEEDSN